MTCYGCPWMLATSDRKLGYFTYVSGTYPSPTFIGVSYNPLILSTMDIPAVGGETSNMFLSLTPKPWGCSNIQFDGFFIIFHSWGWVQLDHQLVLCVGLSPLPGFQWQMKV